jgi:hypothetical protein
VEVVVRDRDRLWWLIVLIGLAFCIAAVVAPYAGVRSIPMNNPYFTSADNWQMLGAFGALALTCLGSGIAFLVMAVHGRRYHRQRLAALRGDTEAMPLAEMRIDPTLAPDVTEKPLELLWRTGTATRVVYAPLLGFQALFALASVELVIVELIVPIFASPQPVRVTELVLRVAGAAVVVAVVVVLGVVTTRVIPQLFGSPFGVTATDSGMDARTVLGTRVHLGWDEMRLLEAVRGDAEATRRFALYAPGKRIAWSAYAAIPGARFVPVGTTVAEMTLRHAALLNLISVRTGLAPRTLVKALQIKQTPTRGETRGASVAALLVVALILAVGTAAEYFFPLTPVPWVNWLSVGSLALTTLFLIVASVWEALARSRLPAHAGPPAVGAPSLEAPGVAYVLSGSIPLSKRLAFISFGLCLAVNLAPDAWILLHLFGAMLPGVQSHFLADGVFAATMHFVLAVIFAMIGLIGLAVVFTGLRGGTTVRIRADQSGLARSSGQLQDELAWSSILGISWEPDAGERLTYVVKSNVSPYFIFWPAGPHLTRAVPPGDDAVPIGADELAALVAARIGKPIEVRR